MPDSPPWSAEVNRAIANVLVEVADAGAFFWLEVDRANGDVLKLHVRTTRGPLSPALRERIRQHRDRVIIEVLVTLTMRWREEAWSRDELARIRTETPEDLRERQGRHIVAAMDALRAGDVGAARAALSSLRNAWRASARAVGAPDRMPPDDFPHNPPPKESPVES